MATIIYDQKPSTPSNGALGRYAIKYISGNVRGAVMLDLRPIPELRL